jgi:hypothetical protein
VGDGLAALEPVEFTVRSGPGGRPRQAVYWRALGLNDDDLHAQLDRHSLVVARCWGQNGCCGQEA